MLFTGERGLACEPTSNGRETLARLTQQGNVAGILAQSERLEEERKRKMVLALVLVALRERYARG
jgi:hypothetical protein